MSFTSCFKGIKRARPPEPTGPVVLKPPEKVFLPLRQHRGQTCEPVVEVGQDVAMGQVVGSSDEFESAAVLASVSGRVEGLVEMPDPSGQLIPTLIIANDGQDTWQDPPQAVVTSAEEVTAKRPTRLLKPIRQAGLVRAAIQGLPLHVDLSPPMAPRSYLFMTGMPVTRQVDTLVVKAVDPDPPICPNHACLKLGGPELEIGILALARIAGATEVIVVHPAGAELGEMAEMAKNHLWNLSAVSPTKYPFTTDNLLIHHLTGREVPTPYGEPRDVGVVIEPLQTALEVGTLLLGGRPSLERVFSVAGDVANPQTFRVRLGTPVSQVLAAAGGPTAGVAKAVLGGPMMGYAHYDLDTPVTKETEGLFIQCDSNLVHYEDHPCIHCGRCVRACPVNLIPSELGKLCEFKHFDKAMEMDLFHCIECGVCAYVCPARRPMVHLLRHGKTELLAGRMEE